MKTVCLVAKYLNIISGFVRGAGGCFCISQLIPSNKCSDRSFVVKTVFRPRFVVPRKGRLKRTVGYVFSIKPFNFFHLNSRHQISAITRTLSRTMFIFTPVVDMSISRMLDFLSRSGRSPDPDFSDARFSL